MLQLKLNLLWIIFKRITSAAVQDASKHQRTSSRTKIKNGTLLWIKDLQQTDKYRNRHLAWVDHLAVIWIFEELAGVVGNRKMVLLVFSTHSLKREKLGSVN